MCDLGKVEDDKLIDELESRRFHVFDYDPEDQECEMCQQYEQDLGYEHAFLEKLHQLIGLGKTEDVINQIRDLIYDKTGRIS